MKETNSEEHPKPQALSVVSRRPLEPVDPWKRYLQEVRRYPFLTEKEERELARRFRETGDREAARRLVTSHLRLVVKIAAEYKIAYGRLFDLVQEGNLGLMQAVKRYDPNHGARLSSYANWWIRSYILKFILDNFRLIKIGTTTAQRRIFFNLMKEKERIEKMGFKANTKRLAAALEVKPEELDEMQGRLEKSDLSLDAPAGPEGKQTTMDLLPGKSPELEENIDQARLKDVLDQNLKIFAQQLNDREAKIFHKRLLAEMPLTLQAIADEYGVTRERARQIEVRIKEKLKKFFEDKGIKIEEHL